MTSCRSDCFRLGHLFCLSYCWAVADLTTSNPPEPDLAGFWTQIQPDPDLRRNCFEIKLTASTMLSAAIKSSASFVTSLFASFGRNLWNSDGFCIFIDQEKLIKILNAPHARSDVLVLSVFNWTSYSCNAALVSAKFGKSGWKFCRTWPNFWKMAGLESGAEI